MNLGINPQRGRRILSLAGPIIIAMVTQTFINVVDTIYIGKLDPAYSIPGQAALGFSLPVYWSIGGFLAAISVGTQAVTARRFGEDDYAGAGATLTNALSVGVIGALTFTLIGWFWVPVVFPWLTSNASVLDLGIPYTRIRILATLPMVCTFAFKGFFDGLGETRVHMWAALIMNAVNVVLNYAFIFGVGPIPAMYVTGAAIASTLSTCVGLVAMIGWSMLEEYRDTYRYYRLSNINPRAMGDLVKLSAPSGAAEIFMMSGALVFLAIVARLDEAAVHDALLTASVYADGGLGWAQLQHHLTTIEGWGGAVLAGDWAPTLMESRPPIYTTGAKLIIDLLSISFVTCIGFGQATATLVSQQMGKGDYKEAERFGWDSVKAGMYLFGAIGLVIVLFPELFLELLSDDPLVIEAAAPGMRIMGSMEAFVAAALILIQAHFGAGNTTFVMYTEAIVHIVCLVPLAYLLSFTAGLGFMGIWCAAATYILTLATVLAWKFWEGKWKHIEV
jgi:Na+-driven multidrug efflux pump